MIWPPFLIILLPFVIILLPFVVILPPVVIILFLPIAILFSLKLLLCLLLSLCCHFVLLCHHLGVPTVGLAHNPSVIPTTSYLYITLPDTGSWIPGEPVPPMTTRLALPLWNTNLTNKRPQTGRMAFFKREETMVDPYQAPSRPACLHLSLPARPGLWHFDWAHQVCGGNKSLLRCRCWFGLPLPSCAIRSVRGVMGALSSQPLLAVRRLGRWPFRQCWFGGKCWLVQLCWAGMWQWRAARCEVCLQVAEHRMRGFQQV